MKKYRLKKNQTTKYVLPFLLVSFAVLVGLSFLYPETNGLVCEEIERALFESHTEITMPMSESTHEMYHDRLDACMDKGYVVSYRDV